MALFILSQTAGREESLCEGRFVLHSEGNWKRRVFTAARKNLARKTRQSKRKGRGREGSSEQQQHQEQSSRNPLRGIFTKGL
jgi:hypothetical protein